MEETLKQKIHWYLTLLRDKDWIPEWLREIIDYIRYEWLWDDSDMEI